MLSIETMGRRNPGLWSRLFERSVTEEAVRRSVCPVLVAKAPAVGDMPAAEAITAEA